MDGSISPAQTIVQLNKEDKAHLKNFVSQDHNVYETFDDKLE